MTARVDQILGLAALAVTDRLRASMATVAVTEVEAGALVHVQAWPGETVGDLAGVVALSQPATVRLVDRLVEQGLLRREAGRDRRTLALTLTEAGSRMANAVLEARAEALAPSLNDLSVRERETLAGLLGRVAAGLVRDRAGAVRVCRLCDRDICYSGPGCPLEDSTRSSAPRSRR
jgi:DNA-binding MarR family transcriptional regulator